MKFRADQAGFVTGIRFYKGTGNTRHPHRLTVEQHRHPAGNGHLHRRDRDRLAAGHLRLAGRRHRQHHLRRLLLRAQRPLRRRRGLLRHRRRQLAADRAAERRRRRQRRLPVRRRRRLPDQYLQRVQLLGRPGLHAQRCRYHPADRHRSAARRRRHRRPGHHAPPRPPSAKPVQQPRPDDPDRGRGGVPARSATTRPRRTVTLTPTSQPRGLDHLHRQPLRRPGHRGQPDGPTSPGRSPRPPRPPGARARSGRTPTTPRPRRTADSSAVEVGVKFRTSQAGYITGIRFYKGTGNTGTHVGSLWTSTGTKLASVTFTGETATGWQQATFGAPVPVAANTTYVASYYAPVGRYAVNSSYFATAATTRARSPRCATAPTAATASTATARAASRPAPSSRPTTGWTSSSTPPPPTPRPRPCWPGRRRPARAGWPSTVRSRATFSEPVVGSRRSHGAHAVRATLWSPATHDVQLRSQTATLTPNAPLADLDDLHGHGQRGSGPAGNTMTPVTWSFTTAAAASAAAGPGPWRPDRRRHLEHQPVLEVPGRDPADRGTQRVRHHRRRPP